jgi:acrylyl-CoA reductase (NADPH)
MAEHKLRAILAADREGNSGRVVELSESELPDEPITVEVRYSCLNYKDGLAITGRAPVVRHHPMVTGIDLAGVVRSSSDPRFEPGAEVLATGFGLGEEHFGGHADLARVRPEWLVRTPEALGARRAMAVGTAGLTAMLCVTALEEAGLSPRTTNDRPVLVTGAAGGVGSIAVALLSRLGYEVAASTGRPQEEHYLRHLGASSTVARSELDAGPARPLLHERFAAAVDVVGGRTLASVLATTALDGVVAACGLAGGAELATTVHPFILRGVHLVGVESVRCSIERRERAWQRIAALLAPELIDEISVVEPLERLVPLAGEILAGKTRGRVVADMAVGGK